MNRVFMFSNLPPRVSTTHSCLLRAMLVSSALSALVIAQAGHTQVYTSGPPPVRSTIDENGVDLGTGVLSADIFKLSIGDTATGGISYGRRLANGSVSDDQLGFVRCTGRGCPQFAVTSNGRTETFNRTGPSPFVINPVEATGSTLSANSSNQLIYSTSDGTIMTFQRVYWALAQLNGWSDQIYAILVQSRMSNGVTYNYVYETALVSNAAGSKTIGRLKAIDSSAKYRMVLSYPTAIVAGVGNLDNASNGWLTGISTFNTQSDSCLSQTSCIASGLRPAITISGPGSASQTYTDTIGRTTSVTSALNNIAIRRPQRSAPNVSASFSAADNYSKVNQVLSNGVTSSYSYTDQLGIRTTSVIRAGMPARVLSFDLSSSLVLSDKNEIGQMTSLTYNGQKQLIQVAYPEGNLIKLARDSRNNVVQSTAVPKPGSGQANIVTTASYAAVCSNALICNKPLFTSDANGNVTNYEYDNATGMVLSIAPPAAESGGPRPQTRMSYTIKNGASLLATTSICQTLVTCTGGADEVKTTIIYDDNLRPTIVSKGAGDGSAIATVVVDYDAVGNLRSVDGPLIGNADKTVYRYDGVRQLMGVVSPDPDGDGSRVPSAQRMSYNNDGQLTYLEVGTVADQSDSAWLNFNPQQLTKTSYDDNGRVAREETRAGTHKQDSHWA